MCGDTARWHLTHHSSQPLQKRPSLAPHCGTLAGGIQQRLCLIWSDGLYIPTCSGTSHRMTFQSPSSTLYVKHRLKMYSQSKHTLLFCRKSYGVIIKTKSNSPSALVIELLTVESQSYIDMFSFN